MGCERTRTMYMQGDLQKRVDSIPCHRELQGRRSVRRGPSSEFWEVQEQSDAALFHVPRALYGRAGGANGLLLSGFRGPCSPASTAAKREAGVARGAALARRGRSSVRRVTSGLGAKCHDHRTSSKDPYHDRPVSPDVPAGRQTSAGCASDLTRRSQSRAAARGLALDMVSWVELSNVRNSDSEESRRSISAGVEGRRGGARRTATRSLTLGARSDPHKQHRPDDRPGGCRLRKWSEPNAH